MKKPLRLLFILAIFLAPLFSLATDMPDDTRRMVVVNAQTGETILMGENLDERNSPFSTFKVPLSVAAIDAKILISKTSPVYKFQESYREAHLPDSHWQDTNPQMWLTNSTVWFSKLITREMGFDKIKKYLHEFQYGNEDARGKGDEGITNFWLGTSLKISVLEQVEFLKKLVLRKLPVSANSMELTEEMLHLEKLENGYNFYGKTGGNKECGWFVGWARKDNQFYVFAMNILVHKNLAESGDFEKYPSRIAKKYIRDLILKDFKQ
jgi:beta-lactamase class D